MPSDETDADPLAGLSCVGCGYDLAGLAAAAVCPECSKPIGESIARPKLPWPTWLRLLRTVYFAAMPTIIASPFILPPIARALGLPVIMGRHGALGDVLAWFIVPTWLLGVCLFVALVDRRHWLAWVIAPTLGLLCLWLVAGLSH